MKVSENASDISQCEICSNKFSDKQSSIRHDFKQKFNVKMSKLSRFISSIKNSLSPSRGNSTTGEEPKELTLRIISKHCGIVVIEVPNSATGHILKQKASEKIAANDGATQMIDIYNMKLVRVKTRKPAREFQTIEDLQNNEEFLLIPHRIPFDNSICSNIIANPTERQIAAKTANIASSHKSPQFPAFSIFAMLQEDDLRKVFVTLAQEAAYVLAMTAHANKLIAYYRQRIHDYIKHHKNAKKVLNELGFPMKRVEQAMKLKADNAKAALDWLIRQEIRNPPIIINLDSSDSPRTSLVSSARHNSILSASFEPTGSVKERVEGLLEIVKFYAEKDELVYEDNIREMTRMGYGKEEAFEALRLTRNNVAAAIAQIHGDKNPSIMELRNGLTENSDIRKKFLESPTILHSLSDPASFVVFIGILDNPSQANAWNPFSDMGSLMTHIILTYHEEKHICATNQFNESRIPISALSAPH